MKTDRFTILFTSSGRRVPLIRHFKKVLSELDIHGKIITADLKMTSSAGFIADKHILVPKISSSNYISTLLRICEQYEVSLIIPLIDTELVLFSEHKQQFKDRGIVILQSSKEVNEICYDKRNTAKFFQQAGFDTPKMYNIEQVLTQKELKQPLIIKPAKGSSSIGVTIINSLEELAFHSKQLSEPLLQELVIGKEYTIDVLVGLDGHVITAVPRLRMEIRAGEMSKGMTERNLMLIDKAKELVGKLPGAVGCITVQCFLTEKEEVKFIEINPRFGGGFPLTIQAGADFPRFLIESLLGIKSELNIDDWLDGLVMLRYDDAIFVQKDQII